MALAAGVFFWAVRALAALSPYLALRFPIKKIAAVIAMSGAGAYCLFSGAEVATQRALIMTLVMLGAILADRPALSMRNVALAAMLVMATQPEAVLSPGFQMSFAAVACLIAAHELWQGRKSGRGGSDPAEFGGAGVGAKRRPQAHSLPMRVLLGLAAGILGIIATTLVASLATAPFAALHFHRLNPFGLIGNTMAIPLVSLVVMPAAVAGTLLIPFGFDGPVWQVMGEGVRGVFRVAEAVAALDHATVAVPRAGREGHALFVLALLFIALGRGLVVRAIGIPLLLAAFILWRPAPAPDIAVDTRGRMVLFRGEDGAYRLLSPGNPQAFTLSQWLPALGLAEKPGMLDLRRDTRCDPEGCTGRLADGRSISLVTSAEALRQDCRRAAVLITPLEAPRACKANRLVIDAGHLDRFGATFIHSPQGEAPVLETAHAADRDRVWRRKTHAP
jgi:competence protein ComEC